MTNWLYPASRKIKGGVMVILLSLLFGIGAPKVLQAAPGDLDPSFGMGGTVSGVPGKAYALVVQPDGKLIAAGYGRHLSDTCESVPYKLDTALMLFRYNPDGTPDASFGNCDGIVTTDLSNSGDTGYSLALQPDDKIVAGATANGYFALARYDSRGILDPSFGVGGMVTTEANGFGRNTKAMVLQPDGKIILGGVGLVRFLPDGSLDTGFGSGGSVTTSVSDLNIIYALSLQADGKIVAAGVSGASFTDGADFAVARFNPDGSLDSGFGVGGIAINDFHELGIGDEVRALGLQADGKIVAAGFSKTGIFSQRQFALVRYNTDGSLDSGFGSGGKATADSNGYGIAYALVIQPDGKIVVAGSNGDFVLARFNLDGSLDSEFGAWGQVTTDFHCGDYAYGVALQSDGKIVAAGYEGECAGFSMYRFALARYLVEPATEITVTDELPPFDDLLLPFGDVVEGRTATRTVTVTNDGNLDLEIGNVAQADPLNPPFRVITDNCSGQILVPYGTCTIEVQILPTMTGFFEDTFDIPSNDSNENVTIFNVNGTGRSSLPEITVIDFIPPNTDLQVPFSGVVEGRTAKQAILIKNDGYVNLGIGKVGQASPLSAPFSIINDACSGLTLGPSASCVFEIQFSPTTTGFFTDSFDISSSDPDENPVFINVNGTGLSSIPKISVTDSVQPSDDYRVPFGNVTDGNEGIQTISVKNDGHVDLVIGQVAEANSLLIPFSILSDFCSRRTIAPEATCLIEIQFAPSTEGRFSDSFDIPSNAPDGNPVIINVNGIGFGDFANHPPSVPKLLSPANGQTGLETSVTFKWEKSEDPDGDPVTYDLYYCKNPNFTNCSPTFVAHLGGYLMNYAFAGAYGMVFLTIGILFSGKRRGRTGITSPIILVLVTGMLLGSCADGGGGAELSGFPFPAPVSPPVSPPVSSNVMLRTVTGLDPNTTYYWKVISNDGRGGTSRSEIRDFNTQ